jgi:hypothetical protein
VLLTLETPGYLIVNILTFGVVVSISIICLQLFQDKEPKQTKVDPSLETKLRELAKDAEKIEIIYDDLKRLLSQSCTKETLPYAKELARICSELGPVTANLNRKLEDKQELKVSPFNKGALRRAYRDHAKRVA